VTRVLHTARISKLPKNLTVNQILTLYKRTVENLLIHSSHASHGREDPRIVKLRKRSTVVLDSLERYHKSIFDLCLSIGRIKSFKPFYRYRKQY